MDPGGGGHRTADAITAEQMADRIRDHSWRESSLRLAQELERRRPAPAPTGWQPDREPRSSSTATDGRPRGRPGR